MRTKAGEKVDLTLPTVCVFLSARLCRQWLLAELEVRISYFVGKGIIYKRSLLPAKCLGDWEHTPTTPALEGRRVATREDNQGCTSLKTVREKPSENPTQPW